jgi:organic radical activating enzyme
MSKYFPIKTDTACRLKWSWSSLWLDSGATASCHRSSRSSIPDDFNQFHNTESKKAARISMLQGQWPGDGCEYCQNIESSGGTSDRMFQNSIPDIYPNELDRDKTKISIEPSVLEVFFSNSCNLGCVYCIPELSSLIQQEHKKFNIISTNQYAINDKNYEPEFWSWFQSNGQKLQRLQILGGEPLIQKPVHTLIDYFQQGDFSNLEFNVITNLSVPPKIIDPILEKLADLINKKRLKRVDIQTSIDCWGEQQTYTRYKIDLDLFERNMQRLLDYGVFRIGLLSTVNSLSIMQMPALAEKFQSWNNKQKIFWYMHLVLPVGTSIFDPTIFDYSVFKESIDRTKKMLPESDDWDTKTLKDTFEGIDSTLKAVCSNDPVRQQKLFEFLDSNDHRRNSDWKKIFPWLAKLQKNVV